MPPNHQNGRKFYVTQDENERMRTQRRSNSTKIVKMPNLPASLHRTVTNSFEPKHGILRVPIIRREHSERPSRSILKVVDERKTSVTTPTGRAHSSDRILEHRKTPLDDEKATNDASKIDEVQRSSSAEILQTSSNNSTRRAVPTAVTDYGTTFTPTSTDQTYSQSNASKLTSYFLQMKPSNSIIETGVLGEDRIYTVIGSTNRRSNPSFSDGSSSISTRSTSNSSTSNNEFHSRDVTSGSFSDESSTSLLMLVQRRNNEIQRQRRHERSNSPIHSKESWLESSTRSQFTDSSYEKKRVRFADMEGFTLETIPTKTLQRTPMTNNLLTKRKQNQLINPLRGQTTRPVFNTFYQAIAGVGGGYQRRSKLVTDV